VTFSSNYAKVSRDRINEFLKSSLSVILLWGNFWESQISLQ
jgi:hypothetical protein